MSHGSRSPVGELRIGRRMFIGAAAATVALFMSKGAFGASAPDPRLVVLNIRGGLDGLAAAPPYGDVNLQALRPGLVSAAVGTPGGMLPLGGFYALHPMLQNLHAMYVAGEAAVVHAVGNFADTRSHFEGQDYLQSGAPELLSSGWLDRAIAALPAQNGGLNGSQNGRTETCIAIAAGPPLVAQGPAPVASWLGNPYRAAAPAIVPKLISLTQSDPLLGPARSAGYADSGILSSAKRAGLPLPTGLSSLAALAWETGNFLTAANGPRIAVLQTPSVDTHADQVRRLNVGLADIDAALGALKATMSSVWSSTVVLTMTEFGRTAAQNGSVGTDHGTAFALFVAGGAVAGGRVVAQWPGLAPGQLFEGRDLAPTVDFRAIAMGVLQAHLGLPPSAFATIFPGKGHLSPMTSLVR